MKPTILLPSLLLCFSLIAQDEVIALSPFTVESNESAGYYASHQRLPHPYSNLDAPVKLRKRVDSVALRGI